MGDVWWPNADETWSQHLREVAIDNWMSIAMATFSLFKVSTGGSDWSDLAEPLMHAGFAFAAAFCLYIAFFLFVVMNSLTALFVDACTQYSNRDESAIIQDQL